MTSKAPAAPEFVIRPAAVAERKFIIETTAKARQPRITTGPKGTADVPWPLWARYGMTHAAVCLALGRAIVLDMGSGLIAGFALAWSEPASLEMLYVKRDYRGHGYGLRLLWALGLPEKVPISMASGPWRQWTRYHGIDWEELPREFVEVPPAGMARAEARG